MNSEAFAIVAYVVIGGLFLYTVAWACADARKRGASPLVAFVLMLITWPIGILIWRALRPKLDAEKEKMVR